MVERIQRVCQRCEACESSQHASVLQSACYTCAGSSVCVVTWSSHVCCRQELTEDALGFDDVARWRLTAELATVSGHLYSSDAQDPVLGLLWQARTLLQYSYFMRCPGGELGSG